MCMVDDSDGPCRVAVTESRKARKTHRCYECNRWIQPGEQYEHTSGISYDGDAFRHKVCTHCQVAAKWLSLNCGGYVMQMVAEDLNEHAVEYARPDLLDLVTGMQKQWLDRDVPELPRPLKAGDARTNLTALR